MTDYLASLAEMEQSNSREKSDPALSAPLRTYGLNDFLSLNIPVRKMLLSPWLTEKGLAMIFAPRGIGKTFLGLTAAYAVAVGGEFLGFKAPRPRKVLYIDGEMACSDLQERVGYIAAGFNAKAPDQDYFRMLSADVQEFGLPDLAMPEGLRAINNDLKDADLIVLDNLSTLVRSGKENEAEAWSVMQAWILGQRRAGRSVLLIHHAGKNGGQRGTSKREDVLDTIIGLERPDGYRSSDGARFNLKFEKSRHFHGPDAEDFEARYEVRDGKALWSRQKIPSKVEKGLAAISQGMSLRGAAKATGIPRSTIQRHRKMQGQSVTMTVPLSQTLGSGTLGQVETAENAAEFAPPLMGFDKLTTDPSL